MEDFNVLKNWAPQAMSALRQSNIKTNMVNPDVVEEQKKSPGIARGLIGGLI